LAVFYLGIFTFSVLLSFILTRKVRNSAIAHGWLARPSSDRHVHGAPLPRLGGVAIFFSFLLTVALGQGVSWLYPRAGLDFPIHNLLSLLVPGTLIFLLGIYDDVRGAGPAVKFSVQAIAGAILYAFGLQIFDIPVLLGGHHTFPWFVSLPVTIIWVIAVTNAFNLIDGLDGLAAGSALFSTLVVFVVALLGNSSTVTLSALILAGTILGFLRFNFNPATIFLGDSGSLFIGFMLSALALLGAQKAPTIVAVAIPVVSFGLPILETALSVIRRLISGRPVFTADKEHIHHKLLERGLSHRQVVILLYAVSAVFALLSLFLLWPTGSTLGLVLVVLGMGIWLGVQHLGYLEFGELRRVAQRTIEQRQIFINNMAIRRATEELKVTRDYVQLCRVLLAAFDSNDFDAFELRSDLLPGENPGTGDVRLLPTAGGGHGLYWERAGTEFLQGPGNCWSLTLDLVTADNQRRGSIGLYRLYSSRNLQLDVNLLTTVFPVALADALERVLRQPAEAVSTTTTMTREGAALRAAQAG
jgi:UDP-GlcNAc:undecaprenyl-phosphate/decaprenyl-phosphate GlcNAc-1-phosphate transferase